MKLDMEKFDELYSKYIEADKTYHDYFDGFFTMTWNGVVQREAERGMNQENQKKLKELDGKRLKAQKELDDYIRLIHE